MISAIAVERGEEGRWGDVGTELICGSYLGSARQRGGKDLLLCCASRLGGVAAASEDKGSAHDLLWLIYWI